MARPGTSAPCTSRWKCFSLLRSSRWCMCRIRAAVLRSTRCCPTRCRSYRPSSRLPRARSTAEMSASWRNGAPSGCRIFRTRRRCRRPDIRAIGLAPLGDRHRAKAQVCGEVPQQVRPPIAKTTNADLDHRAEPLPRAVSDAGLPFLNTCRANVQRGVRSADRKFQRRDGPGMRCAWPRDCCLPNRRGGNASCEMVRCERKSGVELPFEQDSSQ